MSEFNFGENQQLGQPMPVGIQRAQLQYPLDAQSEGALKLALENVLKDVIVRSNRIQFTIPAGTTSFDVASSYMVLTAAAAVTIATIKGGREGMTLTLEFTDANVTITDTGTGAADTVNLSAAFTSSANDVIQLQHDGTSWREVGRTTIADNSITLAKMAGGTDGNLITYDANGDPAYVTTGNSGEVLTSNGAGAAPTFQAAAGGGSITSIVPRPANAGITGASSDTTFNATTRMYVYMFNLPQEITVNKISIKTGGSATTDVTWDLTIYSEDGQTQELAVTTAQITTGDTIYSTAVSAVTLSAGNHYFAINPGSDPASCNFYTWTAATNQAMANAVSLATDVASEPKLMGYVTISVGTPPATFDPTAITEDTMTNSAPIFRLDN